MIISQEIIMHDRVQLNTLLQNSHLTCELTYKIKQQRFNGQPRPGLEGCNIIRLNTSLASMYMYRDWLFIFGSVYK